MALIEMHPSADALCRALDKAADIISEEIIVQLQYLGEECVAKIRKKHDGDWTDRTANLRSSIGFAVFDYGKKVAKSAFETVTSPDGNIGSDGSKRGKQYIEQLASKYADVYALVVVAGMDYADAVETKRDVLEGAKLWATKVVDQYVADALKVAERRIERLLNSL